MNAFNLSFRNFGLLALGLGLGLSLAAQTTVQPAAPVKQVYNEQADARADLNRAVAQAAAAKKQVLVVYGANWCGDCQALDRKMSDGTLAGPVAKRYVTVKVDVGRFNRNLDVAEQMGVSLKKGIPAVAVLGADGQLVGATNGGELADARNMGDDAVLKVLDGMQTKR
ncbi:thioredoxin family protein [Paucibacter sp. APW11]|uniref:Thioredoxin family protein n=1 Tax=Roseateles aquae TaxID=3077235 RepID=A0ABU3PDC7_9BURK|nr:thioredoxin family protein [Paucibacter sp. APW11]MDT9000606.1 thioredoxin family protein [Paucibacter sp. APW11]